ncbi:cupin domain-containing protein [Streptomyces herbicida]|uniref:cupin domain-containing protein n=1 Tax=Streptomyces herbicida TaxID=3065675 RepID=UPI00292EEFE7|nr:cupin domain-containing protein [Streptomyces sp. NEAU-HV9]
MTDEPTTSEPTADPAVSVVGPGEGETIVLGTTRMRVLEDGSNTGHRLGIAESVLAPHTPGPPQHRHARHDEGFYIVCGTVRFTVGQKEYDATAGTLVMVPPGAPHTFANVTGQPAVMLSTFTPDLYVQYFRDLRELFAGGRAPVPQANIRVMSRYATELATDFAQK